jgi:peptide/nickel transport system permease protein
MRYLVSVFQFIRRWPIIPIVVLVVLVICAIFAPLIAPHDPVKQSLRDRNGVPAWDAEGSATYLLGNDHVGRDVLSRIIYGSRISLMVAGVALASGLLVGSTLGLISGWFGGILDELISRVVDIWYALPFLLVALVVVIVLGQSLQVMMGVLALVAWSLFVRNVRAEVLSLKTRDYVALAQVAGASPFHIMYRHIMPGVLNTIVVIATLNVGGLILTEATLSFLGAGIPSPTPAWGLMVAEGRDYITSAWWISFFPGVAIFLTVMSLNFVGDWLRDRLDPRLRQV